MNWLLIFIPIAVVLEHAWPQAHTWIFFAACVAIVPIARLILEATEHIMSRPGDAVGGYARKGQIALRDDKASSAPAPAEKRR
jgi:Ca2+/H+ antiporter